MAASKPPSSTDLVSPHRLARGKYLALASLIGLGLAGVWHSAQSDFDLRIDRGQANQPHRILIFAYGDQGLAQWVGYQTFTHGTYAFRASPSPVRFAAEQRPPIAQVEESEDQEAAKLDALLSQADEEGFGYIALDLQGPQSESTRHMLAEAAPALAIPPSSRWAVIRSDRRVNDLRISFGEVQSGIEFSQQAAARASLMQALLGDPEIGELHRQDQPLPIRASSELASLPLARRGLDFRSIAWQPFSFAALSQQTIEAWPASMDSTNQDSAPRWLAEPMQQRDAVVLSEQALILKSAPLVWTSKEGTRAVLKSRAPTYGWKLSVAIRNKAGLDPVHCEHVSDTRAFAVRAGLAGDAIEIRRANNEHEVYAIEIDAQGNCRTQLKSRTKAGAEPLVLGLPQASGKSSWIAAGTDKKTLTWRKNAGTGRITLPDRQFVRDRWFWVDEHTLRAVTVDPSFESRRLNAVIQAEEQKSWQFEEIQLDPNAPEGMVRKILPEDVQDPDLEASIPPAPRWAELSYETKPYFGARIPQATYSPNLER